MNPLQRLLWPLLVLLNAVPAHAADSGHSDSATDTASAAIAAVPLTAPVSAAPLSTAPLSTAPLSTPPVMVEPFSVGSLAQLLLGLGLVVALILLLAWGLRRMGGATGFGHAGLRVVASLPLGTRERVVLIQAGEQQLLIGVAPGRVNLLQRFETPVIDPQATPSHPFSDRLRDAMSRNRG